MFFTIFSLRKYENINGVLRERSTKINKFDNKCLKKNLVRSVNYFTNLIYLIRWSAMYFLPAYVLKK